jgi:Mn2+/Fe2+ NRAMP family transporter
VAISFAWLFWFRDSNRAILPKWRSVAFLVGLLAASLNAVLFAGWAVWLHFHYNSESWRVQNVCGNVGGVLCLTAFVGATAGEGDYRARVLVSVSAAMGFMLWVPIGIL